MIRTLNRGASKLTIHQINMDNQLPNLTPSLLDEQLQQQYIYELNDHDVLCGRGSGPNDRK